MTHSQFQHKHTNYKLLLRFALTLFSLITNIKENKFVIRLKMVDSMHNGAHFICFVLYFWLIFQ